MSRGVKMIKSSSLIGCVVFMILILSLVFVLGIVAGGRDKAIRFSQDAIDRGYAQYNPTTGGWEWK